MAPAAARKQTAARAANSRLEAIMTNRDDRIREIAYFLWLDEGCPEGEADRHWSMAEAMHDSQPSERKRLEGEPPGEEPVSADRRHPPGGRVIGNPTVPSR
jgi:Protein of unknown function (DUF2934)